MKRKKTLFIALSIFAAASVLLLVDFDSPEMGRAFMQKVEESTDLQWEAERFRLNLLRGLYVENVTAAGEVSGKRIHAGIKNITVKHRFFPLLRGEISASEIVVEDPEVDLFPSSQQDRSSQTTKNRAKQKASGPESAPRRSSPETGDEKALQLRISELRIQNALITVHSSHKRKPETVIRALSLTLNDLTLNDQAASIIQRLTAKGEVRADEIRIGKARVENSEGQIEIAEGVIRSEELSFETDKGKFQAELDLNLKSSPVHYKLLLKGDPVNTNLVLGGKANDGYGPTRLEFQGDGSGTNSRDLKGQGKFTLEDGKLPSSPVFVTIEQIVGDDKIIDAPYKSGTTAFRVQDNRVYLERFVLQIDHGSLDLSGWVSLDGPLGLECIVRVPRKNVKIKELPDEVLDALTDDEGRVSLPFQIRGIPQNPETRLDTGALLAKAGHGTRKVIQQKITEKLKDFFKKSRD